MVQSRGMCHSSSVDCKLTVVIYLCGQCITFTGGSVMLTLMFYSAISLLGHHALVRVHYRLHIYPLCAIFYFLWHRNQIEGATGF